MVFNYTEFDGNAAFDKTTSNEKDEKSCDKSDEEEEESLDETCDDRSSDSSWHEENEVSNQSEQVS